MDARARWFCALLVALGPAGCGGGSSGSSAPVATRPPSVSQPVPPGPIYTAQAADTPVSAAPFPTPLDPAKPASGLAVAPLRASARSAGDSVDHEAQGLFFNGQAPPFDAIFGIQTAYEATQAPFPLTNGSGGDQAYAPTLHMGWGDCLETSTAYQHAAGGETAQFAVYDFCSARPGFIFTTTIDAAFLRRYVRRAPTGLPSYAVETFTPDVYPSGTSTWYAVLYDFTTATYDLVATAKANGNFDAVGVGWSLTELYRFGGGCPKLAPTSASGLALFDAVARTWDGMAPLMSYGVTSSVDVQGQSTNVCFLGTPSTPNSLDFQLLTASSWELTSPR